MIAVGIALAWLAYTSVLYGHILWKQYNVSFLQLFSSEWPPPPPKNPI